MNVPRPAGDPPATAWEVAVTRSYWWRMMTLVLVPGAVGVVLLIAAAVSWNGGRDNANARTARSPGVVSAITALPVGRGRALSGSITVDFEGGATRASVAVGTDVRKYSIGQSVTVRFQPDRPTNASVVGSPGRSTGWIVSAVFGVFIVGAMGWAARHLRRLRHVLERHPWQARPARIAEIPVRVGMRMRAQIVVVLWDPTDEQESIVSPAGIRRVNPGFQPVTWLCGDVADGPVAIAPPGGRPPLLARSVTAPAQWAGVGDWPT
jgi:hypothetical protein